jgi:hypothetical protein
MEGMSPAEAVVEIAKASAALLTFLRNSLDSSWTLQRGQCVSPRMI